jgi:glycosyltransferase involved in cell wall biosynthesis
VSPEQTGRPAVRVAVITPVFNDWACVPIFLSDLAEVAPEVGSVSLLIVDDGSTESFDVSSVVVPASVDSVEILRLGCNLGHQRAIATGLVEAASRHCYDAVIVIDVDGEDRPADIAALWSEHLAHPDAIVVAQRRGRSEAIRFRMFYSLYKRLFHSLTGKQLDFGNFVLLPRSVAERMVYMTELWNHFPATVMRARIPIVKVPLDRQKRSVGESRMNFTSLVNHGLAAIAAFVDTVFVRLLVLVATLTVLLLGFAVVVIVVSSITLVTIPSWVGTAVALALGALVLLLTMLVVVTFLNLSTRSTLSLPPSEVAVHQIARIERAGG